MAAVVLGLGLGIGAPVFYTSRIDEDEKNLEDLRKLNRETFKQTGEYLTEVRSCFWRSSIAFPRHDALRALGTRMSDQTMLNAFNLIAGRDSSHPDTQMDRPP